MIGETVRHLRGLDYPRALAMVVVIADDCSDDTVEEARAAGALVLAKAGPASGKGAGIQWALRQDDVRTSSWQALVILDADSRPRPEYLSVIDAAVSSGAEATQARTESIEPEGWVARAYALNTSQRNRLWHQARERVGFSAALTGTGVCLTRDLLERYPFETQTVTEDLEYSAMLTAEGVRVRYLYDAVLDIEQPDTLGASVTQRVRWARGQMMTTLREGPKLVVRAIRRHDLSAFDTAMYLAMPSLVPFQSLLLCWLLFSVVVDTSSVREFPGIGALPLALTAAVLALSLAMPSIGIVAERRRLSIRDWLGFLALMTSWIPLALYGALTAGVRTWKPTPHGRGSATKRPGPTSVPGMTLPARPPSIVVREPAASKADDVLGR